MSLPCEEGAMGNPTCQGGELENIWQNQSDGKGKVPKPLENTLETK